MALRDVATQDRNEDGIATAVAILKQKFGERLSTSESMREQHAHTVTYIPNQMPDAVVFAESTEEVQEIVKTCAKHKVPIIPYGTGTSLEGGVNAPAGGISIDMNSMDKVLAVNVEDGDVIIQPGVTREALNEHLRATGLFFPIDPGANASLGGMAATRASGTNAVRYGTMRDNVINLTAVMPDGRVVRTARRSKKTSAGYDLTRLMVGSEGTLGIITELTLKLYGIPEAIWAATCSFPSVEAACNATILTIQSGIPVARIELLDAETVDAVNQYSGLENPLSPMLFLEFHGTTAGVKEQVEQFSDIAREFGGAEFRKSGTTEERSKLWKARHDAYWAALAQRPGKDGISTDVCVPISRLAECVVETQQDIAEAGLYGPVVGHVGDGNFHCLLLIDPADQDEVARAEEVIEKMAMRALAMDGTCTGEHGIGQGKRRFVRLEHGAGADVMLALKQAIDPDNIMNPGKVVGFD